MFVLIVIFLFNIQPSVAKAADDSPFLKLWIKGNIQDDKDRNDAVKFQIIDKNKKILAEAGPVGAGIVWHDGPLILRMIEVGSANNPNFIIRFKPSECSVLKPKLVVTKVGNNGAFKASFKVVGWTEHDTPYLLLSATKQAVFGDRNPLVVNPIPGGIQGGIAHESGPLTQSFDFTCNGVMKRAGGLAPF